MPFQLDVVCSKIFEICFSSMGCLYKQVHRWNTYSFLGLRPRPMAPALLVVQLLLPSHWEDWWRATILPGANGWEKDCTSWARLLWSCMFPAIRKILGIIRIYFEIYIYLQNVVSTYFKIHRLVLFFSLFGATTTPLPGGRPPQRPPQPREPRPPNIWWSCGIAWVERWSRRTCVSKPCASGSATICRDMMDICTEIHVEIHANMMGYDGCWRWKS